MKPETEQAKWVGGPFFFNLIIQETILASVAKDNSGGWNVILNGRVTGPPRELFEQAVCDAEKLTKVHV